MILMPQISHLQKYSYSLYSKTKTRKFLVISLSAAAFLCLDNLYGFQISPRLLDRFKVYWLNKRISIDEMDDSQLQKALSNCQYPEHLLPYFESSLPLGKSEKKALQELAESITDNSENKGCQANTSSTPYSFCKGRAYLRTPLATTINYWYLFNPQLPPTIKMASAHSNSYLKPPFSFPFKNPFTIFAWQNLLSLSYEILIKMKLLDPKSPRVQNLEKLSKRFSINPDGPFFKKDRKVEYALIQLLTPFLLIYIFESIQSSNYQLGYQRLKALKNRPFSLPTPQHNLNCLHEDSKKILEDFLTDKTLRFARVSGALDELMMSALKDFESLADLKSLIAGPKSPRLLYVDPAQIVSKNLKKTFLIQLKEEVCRASSCDKQQVALIINGQGWDHLKKDKKLFTDFLASVEDFKIKLLFIEEKTRDAEEMANYLTPEYNAAPHELCLTPPVGELLKRYYESHPLAVEGSKYVDTSFLEKSFANELNETRNSKKTGSILASILKRLDTNLTEAETLSHQRKWKNSSFEFKKLDNKIKNIKNRQRKLFIEALNFFKDIESIDCLDIGDLARNKSYQDLQSKQRVVKELIKSLETQQKEIKRKLMP